MANLSTFPETPDTFTTHTDASASDGTNIARWKVLAAKTDKTAAEITEFNTLTSTLAGKLLTADDLNKLQDCIKNLETFYSEDIYDYIDNLALSIPVDSPTFTGTPTSPTAAKGTNTKQIATTEFVQQETNGIADKVTDANSGNLAGLDSNGNLTDSGKKPSDFSASIHTHTPNAVGLANVPNVTTNNQTPTYNEASTLSELTSGEVLSTAFGKIKKAIKDLLSHLSNTSNPHSVTVSQIGALSTSGGTMTGAVELPASGNALKCLTTSGITVDAFFNFIQNLTSESGSYWWIKNKAGVPVLTVYFDTGNLVLSGGLTLGTALPVLSGGTEATTAAGARANLGAAAADHTHSLSSLGIRTVSGTYTLAANYQYLDISVSGFTTADIVLGWQRNDSGAAGGAYPINVYAYASGTLRVYFADAPSSSQSVPLKITYISV